VIRFVVVRLLQALLVLVVVAAGCFALMRVLPGGPFDADRALDPVVEQNLRAAYDLDAPVLDQFLRWAADLALRGDLGPSLRYRDYDVSTILAESLPQSFALGSTALLLALALGLTAGAAAALRRGGLVDTAVMAVATVGLAVPNFVVAGVLVLVFALHWQLFPVAGRGTAAHLVLPAIALGLPFAATVARLFRGGLLEVLGEDWIRTARAKGAGPLRVLLSHAARPACLPVVSALGPATAGILAGSLVVERVFGLGGLGSHFVESAMHADYNLALGVLLVYATLLTLANLAVDLAYGLLDPRLATP
jgi:oligopeptide transport system permease protein